MDALREIEKLAQTKTAAKVTLMPSASLNEMVDAFVDKTAERLIDEINARHKDWRADGTGNEVTADCTKCKPGRELRMSITLNLHVGKMALEWNLEVSGDASAGDGGTATIRIADWDASTPENLALLMYDQVSSILKQV